MDTEITVQKIAKSHPKNLKPVAAERAICMQIERLMRGGKTFEEAAQYLLERTKLYAQYVARWPKDQLQFVPQSQNWFIEGSYAAEETLWECQGGNDVRPNPAIEALRKASGR